MTRRARQLTVVLLCLLAAQFVLGMTANIYARIPPALPGMRGNFDARLQRRLVGASPRPARG